MWVRRCWNEAADALSKNDMARFGLNVKGDRTLIKLEPRHLKPPLGGRGQCFTSRKPKGNHQPSTIGHLDGLIAQGGPRERLGQAFERRPVKQVPVIPAKATSQQLTQALRQGLKDCGKQAKAKVQVASANHYKRFCRRAGHKVLAPPLKDMRDRVKLWMYDAPQTYVTPDGKTKKGIMTSSIKTYLSHIDRWYSDLTQETRGCISRFGAISNLQKIIDANFKCGDRQVHGITYDDLQRIMKAASQHPPGISLMLRASYSLAFYALLRPTEYMLTPRHNKFDECRHMRACDIQFKYKGRTITPPTRRRLQIVSASTSKCQRTTRHTMALLRSS
jgi:integrase